MDDSVDQVLALVAAHDEMMRGTINLVASGNLISPAQRVCMQSDLLSRAAEGRLGDRVFPGLRFFDEIEAHGQRTVARMLGSWGVELRPISGSQANLAILATLTKPGDTVLCLALKHGGHVSTAGKVHSTLLGVQRVDLPWDDLRCDIEYSRLDDVVLEHKPSVIIVGGSVMLYPPRLDSVVKAARLVGARTVYDASHTAAFVLTGLQPNPLSAGIDVMSFTTCKTIPGPSHAVIACEEGLARRIGSRLFPGLLSGGHLNEFAAAVIALDELEAKGREYCREMLTNARELGEALSAHGFSLVRDPFRAVTETHQVLLDCRALGGGGTVEGRLENGGILANRNMLWWDTAYENPSGVRIGSQEVTRLGMTCVEMRQIALWIKELIIDEVPAGVIADRARRLRRDFQDPSFCSVLRSEPVP